MAINPKTDAIAKIAKNNDSTILCFSNDVLSLSSSLISKNRNMIALLLNNVLWKALMIQKIKCATRILS